MTDANIAREAVVAGVSAASDDAEMRVARQAVVVAHHFPEALTELLAVRIGVVVAISRPHGWNVFDDPPL